MEQYRNEVLELQELEEEFASIEGRKKSAAKKTSTKVCLATVGATLTIGMVRSSVSFRCR